MPTPVPLALVITELRMGGAERCLTELALGLARRGRYAPGVYSLASRPKPPHDGLVLQLEAAGIPLTFLNANHLWQAPLALERLRREFSRRKPELVQTFLYHANVIGCRAACWAGCPRIVTGIRVADRRRMRYFIERQATRNAAWYVCVSQSLARFAEQTMRLEARKLRVIPNGIDVAAIDALPPADLTRDFGIPAGTPCAAVVGRLGRQKGIDWLLELMPQAVKRLPSHRWLIVGDGPERAALERRARELHIAGQIHWLGWRADARAIIKACDLLVHPARWEGMPNVVLEAMACRKPILATRAEGVEELLGPAALEQTMEFGDSAAFIERLEMLANDTGRSASIAARNYDRAQGHFSLNAMLNAYESLYEC